MSTTDLSDVMSTPTTDTSFTEWMELAEPRIRQSLTATFGPQAGREATIDAFAIAWERWSEIASMANPIGYVYGIGRNTARRQLRARRPRFTVPEPQQLPDVEPALPRAVAALSERQRIVVSLVHGFGWTMSEVAELLDISKSTVQNHAERGLASLRTQLGVEL